MKIVTLKDNSNWAAIAWYNIRFPVVIAFRAILQEEKNIRIL